MKRTEADTHRCGNDQGKLAVYAGRRTSDGAPTVIVLNKTYGDLTSTVTLAGVAASRTTKRFVYSNANLAAIVAQPDLPLSAAGPASS